MKNSNHNVHNHNVQKHKEKPQENILVIMRYCSSCNRYAADGSTNPRLIVAKSGASDPIFERDCTLSTYPYILPRIYAGSCSIVRISVIFEWKNNLQNYHHNEIRSILPPWFCSGFYWQVGHSPLCLKTLLYETNIDTNSGQIFSISEAAIFYIK